MTQPKTTELNVRMLRDDAESIVEAAEGRLSNYSRTRVPAASWRTIAANLRKELGDVKTLVGQIGQKLDDHIVDHPAAGRRA